MPIGEPIVFVDFTGRGGHEQVIDDGNLHNLHRRRFLASFCERFEPLRI